MWGTTWWLIATNVPCTWSTGSMRFFSAGMYFNTTVSSPLYCMVESKLPSIYTNIHNTFVYVCLCNVEDRRWQEDSWVLPWAAGHTTPLFRCQAPRSQRSAPTPPGNCCAQTGRGATQTPAGFGSPAASGLSHTTQPRKTLTLSSPPEMFYLKSYLKNNLLTF